jgi:hypothetical protein
MSAPTNDAEHRAFHTSAAELAEKAWNEVRGDDPEFKSCLSDFRGRLVFVAQSVIKTGHGGAVGLEAFEAEVKRLLEPEPVVEDNPPPVVFDPNEETGKHDRVIPSEPGAAGHTTFTPSAAFEPQPATVPGPDGEPVINEFPLPTAHDDAVTLRNSQPGPADDDEVSAAARRLRERQDGDGE